MDEHGHGLKSWAIYKHVAHRAPFETITDEIGQCFGLPVTGAEGHTFKGALVRRYQATYQALLAKIVAGPLAHADETEVHLKKVGKGYVWVFTNLEEVVFLYRKTLFTFLDHDGVPWNNNNAEHAVKQFAYYRELADGLLAEQGLTDYLVLLSIRLTCKYKGVSFLKFLLSRQTNIDVFAKEGARKELIPALELHPEGVSPSRASRRKTWNKLHRPEEQPQLGP